MIHRWRDSALESDSGGAHGFRPPDRSKVQLMRHRESKAPWRRSETILEEVYEISYGSEPSDICDSRDGVVGLQKQPLGALQAGGLNLLENGASNGSSEFFFQVASGDRYLSRDFIHRQMPSLLVMNVLDGSGDIFVFDGDNIGRPSSDDAKSLDGYTSRLADASSHHLIE